MRLCVIQNPAARGGRARRFAEWIEREAPGVEIWRSAAPGGGRELGCRAVVQGFDTVVAMGGDGTVNEVLNGVASVPGALGRVSLAVLPAGTQNVFARELGMPWEPGAAWAVVQRGATRRIDLGRVSYRGANDREQRYFAQLAGAGLDSRAIGLVSWECKRRFGGLAYVWAGLRALWGRLSEVTASDGSRAWEGQLVLVGNGRFYGGGFKIFPRASLTDGLLDVCVVRRVRRVDLAWRAWGVWTGTLDRQRGVQSFQVRRLELCCHDPLEVEVEGENVGLLPAVFEVVPAALSVVVP